MAINLDPWLADTTETEGRYSFNQWALDGSHVNFGINFQGVAPGYLDKAHVKYYVNDADGGIYVAPTVVPTSAWQSASVIQLYDTDGVTPLPSGYTLSIYRDSPKDQPIPNFTDGSVIDEDNLDEGFRQSVYAVAEMVDRFGVSQDQSQQAIDKANTAIATADAATTTANAATATANSASSTATVASAAAANAVATANAASATANAIDAKAQTALDNSATAVTTANAASATANGIAAKAQAALDNSVAANNTATAANTNASNAVTTANGIADTANAALAASSTASTAAAAAVTTANAATLHYHGQCRFQYVSSTQCQLIPFNGRGLIIDGVLRDVPLAGITLSSTGLSVSTLYYIYAYMNGSTMTLEASTTAYTTDSTYGIKVKSGDSTRTLVGMVSTPSTGGFLTDTGNRLVASYFNRRVLSAGVNPFPTTMTTTNTTQAALGQGLSIMCWADEQWRASAQAVMSHSAVQGTVAVGLWANGAAVGPVGRIEMYRAGAIGSSSVAQVLPTAAEGRQNLQASSYISAGTGTYSSGWLQAEAAI